MKAFILLLFIAVCLGGFCQSVQSEREEITPRGVTEIGGTGYFNEQLYLLLPANIRYGTKTAETSESKTISQKYKVWDIFQLDQSTGDLENMSKKWKTTDASPNGFCLINDSTVVYTNNKSQLISNNPFFNSLFKKVNNSKYHFSDPCYDTYRKRIYFASDRPGGAGGMDIWYIETEGSNAGLVVHEENLNSPMAELSPSLPNDSLVIFVSNNNSRSYDIMVYDFTDKKIRPIKETPGENEFFTLSPRRGVLYFVSSNGKKQSLWKGTWSIRRIENIENIAPVIVEEIALPVVLPEPEMVKIEEISSEDPDFRLTNYFGLAKYDLTPLMKDSLDKIASMLELNPSLNIVICGHASPDGPDNLNMMLSYYRATEAYKWLLSKGVNTERIFRIYGGEYLYSDKVSSRMFSIFPVNETGLPNQTVVVPASAMKDLNTIYPLFGTDADEIDYLRFILKKQLPVDDQTLLLLPVKDIHFVKKGETVYSISNKYGSSIDRIKDANNLKDGSVLNGKLLLIPGR